MRCKSGGQVIAEEIVILGSVKGMVHAGSRGNVKAFVAALSMTPMQLRIGNIISRSPDEDDNQNASTSMAHIAYVYEQRICMEPIDGKMDYLFLKN